MIVTDASALVSYVLKEKGFERIGALLGRGAVSMDLVIKESFNAVFIARRRALIDEELVQRSLEVLLELTGTNVKLHPPRDLLKPAFEIASKNNLAFYDALYLALAAKLGAELLSRDARQIAAAERIGVKVVPL